MVLSISCLLGGCGDKKTTVENDKISQSSVSSSEKSQSQDKEKTTDKSNQGIGQDQEPEGDGFVSDWRAGNENYYGYGKLSDWNRAERLRNFVVQDEWLYYANQNIIYKMPIDGGKEDVQIIWSLGREYYQFGYSDRVNLEVVKDWVYYLNESENGGICRVRTDGQMREVLLTKDQVAMTGESVFYVVGDRIYHIAKEMKGAAAASADYYWAYYDLNTKDVVKLKQLDENSSLQACYEDSVIISGAYVRMDLEGNIITQFAPEMQYDEMKQVILWEVSDGNPVFMNYSYSVSGFGFRAYPLHVRKYYQDGTVESTDIMNFGNVYVDVVSNEVICEGHYPYEIPLDDNDLEAWSGIYYGSSNGEYIKINSDCANTLFAGIGEYVYYNANGWGNNRDSYQDGYVNYPISYRVKRDGTGFEDVSWMYVDPYAPKQ
jgi:hypothetical protein